MSKSKKVLVAVGASPTPKLPRQKYDNIFTKYNMPFGMPPEIMADPVFFNQIIDRGIQIDQGIEFNPPPSIYGFLKGGYCYSSPDSLQEIVDVFNIDDDIEIVVTDILVKKADVGAEFIDYGHSEAVPDLPFFIKDSLVNEVRFENSPEMFKKALESLVTKGKKIYHIGEPLLTSEIIS